MEKLPFELINLICQSMTLKEMACLSLANRYIYQFIFHEDFYLLCKSLYKCKPVTFNHKYDLMVQLIKYEKHFKRYVLVYNFTTICGGIHNIFFSYVCKKGCLEIATWLVEMFPQIDVRSDHDIAFVTACKHKHFNVAEWLIEICPPIAERYNGDIFDYACEFGKFQIAEWIIKKTHPSDLYRLCTKNSYFAWEYHNFDIVELIVKTCPQIKIHKPNEEDLVTACRYGCVKLIELFVKKNPQINIRFNNDAPFQGACERGHLKTAKLLIEICPQIDIRANNDRALSGAVTCNFIEMIEWLIEICPINDVPSFCNRAFQFACEYGYLKVAKSVFKKYSNIDIRANNDGAFYNALDAYDYKTIRWLVKKCPQIIEDENRKNAAFEVTCKHCSLKNAKWLFENWPQINIRANKDDVFKYVCRYRKIKKAKWLAEICSDYIIIQESPVILYKIKKQPKVQYFSRIKSPFGIIKDTLQNKKLN